MLNNWIGKEIEYRHGSPLKYNNEVFRGRIVKIDKFGYFAKVKVTYYASILTDFRFIEKNTHFKTVYFNTGLKYPWKPINNEIFHFVKWSKNKWKWTKNPDCAIHYLDKKLYNSSNW